MIIIKNNELMIRRFFKTLFPPGPQYSLCYASILIVLSSLVCVPTFCWLFLPELSLSKFNPSPIRNLFLVSSTLSKVPPTAIAEHLRLSADAPTYLHEFSIKEAESSLHALGIFSSLVIEKSPDNKGITIFYTLQTPIAYVGNRSNTLCNLEGSCFLGQPYFPSLNLPQIFFSQEDLKMQKLPKEKMLFTKILLKELAMESPKIIDLSLSDAYPGEIIVTLSSGSLLRLPIKTLDRALDLYKHMKKSPVIESEKQYVYDLRFPNFLLLKAL
ncbi:Uncharacterized protein BN1224_CV14_A_09480 [Chlamydia pneumoniae]|uniref:Cell division protein FtsQ n=3 Tax=Chlamydia pneumoniae TaxID=83558 RepID=A0A0F7XT28_CHLPN|nr:CT764 hypothetical protein [Chlamydia pneumoniae CWL029]CRI33439.1 Uncharacterized protein BN1224_Wien1_A_09460 [Chlamydia pneumoniae]BAA99116.1 CT764 hypothetical protein [Chlamydia pneumoniae J138]CRI36302.1 Uncharacterized protein BN1224_CM1_A_09490 [Chlamydia pneumoniae]CRI37429.1 Uncharacterized protein BN1224_CV14_A_09480 [Chlamydia pneumoniae]